VGKKAAREALCKATLLWKPWKGAGSHRSLEKSRWKTLDFSTLYTAPEGDDRTQTLQRRGWHSVLNVFFIKITHYKPWRPGKGGVDATSSKISRSYLLWSGRGGSFNYRL